MAPETNPEELLSDDRPIETASTVPPPPSAPTEPAPGKIDQLVRAAEQAIPWLVLLGDYIGNGTREDPNGRCEAIRALREALAEPRPFTLEIHTTLEGAAKIRAAVDAGKIPGVMTVADLHAGVTTAAPSMHEVRSVLAHAANKAGRLSRRAGAPALDADSSRETLIAWLSWNDPNGEFTDEALVRDGADPLTLDDAWDQLAMVDLDDLAGVPS